MKKRIQTIIILIAGLPVIRHILKFIIAPFYHARGARVLYDMCTYLLSERSIEVVKVYKCKQCHKITAATGDGQIEYCAVCRIEHQKCVDALGSRRKVKGFVAPIRWDKVENETYALRIKIYDHYKTLETVRRGADKSRLYWIKFGIISSEEWGTLDQAKDAVEKSLGLKEINDS